jgi:hypothetical protein
VRRQRLQLLPLLRSQHSLNLRVQVLPNHVRLRLPIGDRRRIVRSQRLHLLLRLLQQRINLLLLRVRQTQRLCDPRHPLLHRHWLRGSLLRSSLLRGSLLRGSLRSLCLIIRLSGRALRHGCNVHPEA